MSTKNIPASFPSKRHFSPSQIVTDLQLNQISHAAVSAESGLSAVLFNDGSAPSPRAIGGETTIVGGMVRVNDCIIHFYRPLLTNGTFDTKRNGWCQVVTGPGHTDLTMVSLPAIRRMDLVYVVPDGAPTFDTNLSTATYDAAALTLESPTPSVDTRSILRCTIGIVEGSVAGVLPAGPAGSVPLAALVHDATATLAGISVEDIRPVAQAGLFTKSALPGYACVNHVVDGCEATKTGTFEFQVTASMVHIGEKLVKVRPAGWQAPAMFGADKQVCAVYAQSNGTYEFAVGAFGPGWTPTSPPPPPTNPTSILMWVTFTDSLGVALYDNRDYRWLESTQMKLYKAPVLAELSPTTMPILTPNDYRAVQIDLRYANSGNLVNDPVTFTVEIQHLGLVTGYGWLPIDLVNAYGVDTDVYTGVVEASSADYLLKTWSDKGSAFTVTTANRVLILTRILNAAVSHENQRLVIKVTPEGGRTGTYTLNVGTGLDWTP